MSDRTKRHVDARNVFGGPLAICSLDPLTGWFRDGCCDVDGRDLGMHVVCAEVTEEFLSHQRDIGNDLITPRQEFAFPGLKPGDRWCVCLSRWKEALDAGVAPPIYLKATHEEALAVVPIETLLQFALDAGENGPEPPSREAR